MMAEDKFEIVYRYSLQNVFRIFFNSKLLGKKGEYVGHVDPTLPNVNPFAFFVIRYWVEMTQAPPPPLPIANS